MKLHHAKTSGFVLRTLPTSVRGQVTEYSDNCIRLSIEISAYTIPNLSGLIIGIVCNANPDGVQEPATLVAGS